MTPSPSPKAVAVAALSLLAVPAALAQDSVVKQGMRPIGEAMREIDRAARAPFNPKPQIAVEPGAATLGPAARPLDAGKIKAAVERFAELKKQKTGTYVAAGYDLNGDGKLEALVLMTSESWCQPQGCPLLIFEPSVLGWRHIGTVNRVRPPVRIASSKTGGWLDLWVMSGKTTKDKGPPLSTVRLQWAANGYPSSASFAAPAKPEAAEGPDLIASAEMKLPEKAKPVAMPSGMLGDDKKKSAAKPQPTGAAAPAPGAAKP
jgi:hypothetical protein